MSGHLEASGEPGAGVADDTADGAGGGRRVAAFTWQQGDDSPHTGTGRGRSWITRAGDYTGALSTTRHDAIAFNHIQDPVSVNEGSPSLTQDGGAVAYAIGEGAHGTQLTDETYSLAGTGGKPGQGYAAVMIEGVAAPLTSGGHPNSNAPGRRKEDDVNLVPYTTKLHNTKSNQAGKLYEDYSPSLQANSPAPALMTAAVRRLTPTECERLQAFPDGHTCLCGVEPYSTAACKCPDSPRYASIGNAVTTTVIEWLGRRLLEAHR